MKELKEYLNKLFEEETKKMETIRQDFKKIEMLELKEPCKSAIKNNECLGCMKLENPDFVGDKECIWICTKQLGNVKQ